MPRHFVIPLIAVDSFIKTVIIIKFRPTAEYDTLNAGFYYKMN